MQRLLPFALVSLLVSLAACTSVPTNQGNTSSSASSSASGAAFSSLIQVTSPKENDTVSSPLTITGQARGNWYFEASFPVRLLDGHGNEVASGPAQAQGDWMTNDFVPFSITLHFSPPDTPTGTLILENDNPSGDPANQKQITIPVQF